MRTKPTAAALAALLTMLACYDEQPLAVEDDVLLATEIPAEEFGAAYADGDSGDDFQHRLTFTVDVLGGLEPHETVTVSIEGAAVDKIIDGQVQVVLPTMASMAYAGAGNRLSYPVGKDFPVVAKWTVPPMDEGATWKQSFQVKLPEKGYYHVAIKADVQGPADKWDQYLIDDIGEEAWLFVADGGGFVTDHFDETVFGDNLIPQPGPFRLRRTPTGNDVAGNMVASASDDDPITIHAIYYRFGNQNAKAAEVSARYVSQSDSRGYTVTKTVPANGKVSFDCPDDFEWILARLVVPTTAEVTADYTIGYDELDDTDCGETVQVLGLANHYLPWKHLNEVIPRIDDYFNKYRARVKWKVRLNEETTHYDRGDDYIVFNSYGWSGRLTAGHEYGHALHNKAIGGTWSASNCGIDRKVHKVSSYKCAFKEGFADYAGWVGEENPEHWENKRYSSSQGAPGEIEGNIAALFHDLIDSNNEGDDETTYSADYVTDVLRTCRVNGSNKRDDVADFVWCLENRVNEDVHNDNFPGLSAPSNVSESATKPSDWSASDIRSTWLKSLER